MLTKNFYNWLLATTSRKTVANGVVDTKGVVHTICTGNTSYERIFSGANIIRASNSTAEGVRIGTGTTPATADDYNLEATIESGYSQAYADSVSINVDADGVSVFASIAVTNTSTEALTISEIGLAGKVCNSSGSSNNTCLALIDRTVLEEPITINPNETKQLTYTIRMNYPTA